MIHFSKIYKYTLKKTLFHHALANVSFKVNSTDVFYDLFHKIIFNNNYKNVFITVFLSVITQQFTANKISLSRFFPFLSRNVTYEIVSINPFSLYSLL